MLGILISCADDVSTSTHEPTIKPLPTHQPGAIFVDREQTIGPISPYVYGANHGPWAFVSFDLFDEAIDSGVTYLRFPGGNYGDRNNLRELEVDRFMELVEMMGVEPSISARLRGGTSEQAAALVHYTNIEKEYGVRYWSIGNEPVLYGDYDRERHSQEWRAIAEAMLAVDPDIILIGPEITQIRVDPSLEDRDQSGWLHYFLTQNGDLVDIVSVHRYPFPLSMISGSATVEQLLANTQEWELLIPRIREIVHEATGRDIPIAYTEVNSHWNNTAGGETTPDSFYSALWWGDVLATMIQQQVEIVAYFTLQSGSRIGGYGLMGDSTVNPSYYVYQLYQRLGTDLVVTGGDEAELSVLAATREDGTLTILLINLSAEEVRRPLQLVGVSGENEAEVWLFDSEHMAEQMDSQMIQDGSTITLAPESMTLFVLGGTD